MLDGEISKYADIFQGVAQGCTLPPNLVKMYINDLIVAVGAARQGVTVGKDTVSGLVFADDFVGIYIRNTRIIADTNREGARIQEEMEGDGERREMCSSCL